MIFREATEKDLSAIIEMIADDDIGKTRDHFKTPLPIEYLKAFKIINANTYQELIVVENENATIIGTLQLSFNQYLTYKGGLRAEIEAVRIKTGFRGMGYGKAMFKWAINRAKERNAHILQLTTDNRRPKALKFYLALGFRASHQGMKLDLK